MSIKSPFRQAVEDAIGYSLPLTPPVSDGQKQRAADELNRLADEHDATIEELDELVQAWGLESWI